MPLGVISQNVIFAQPSAFKYEKLVEVDLGNFNQIPVKPVSKPVSLCFERSAMEWVGFAAGSAGSMALGAAGGMVMLAVEVALCPTLAPTPVIAIGITGGIPGMIAAGATSLWFNLPREEIVDAG